MRIRPRRNRRSPALRELVSEHALTVSDLIWPLFVQEGTGCATPIPAMPGCARYSLDLLCEQAQAAAALGIRAVAVFPALPESAKDPLASAACHPDGLMARALRALKAAVPDLLVIADVAMDPYSSDGHDGIVRDGRILNDETLPILAAMACTQAAAGADIVAPSDMMDGRVAAIRDALDAAGHQEVGICAYCVKYASAFYGPFRTALDSAPRGGDKKSYQMDPANCREVQREVALDEAEGADWLIVKPGLPYLDIVRQVREQSPLPLVVYHVSGEYAMLQAAAAAGWLDYEACLIESLLACKRAGADLIITYGACDAARLLA